MDDVKIVVAVLKRAIQALEARKASLAPIEKMKLRALRLNLDAAQCAVSSVSAGHLPQDRAPEFIVPAIAP